MAFSRSSFRSLLLLGLTAPLLLNGCLPTGQTVVQPYPSQTPVPATPQKQVAPRVSTPAEQAAYDKQVLEPALATINGRISAYEQRLRDWQDLGSRRETLNLTPDEIEQIVTCRNRVADLKNAYKELLNEQQSPMSREQLFNALQEFKEKDIAYLEGDCPQLFNSLNSPAEGSKTTAQEPHSLAPPPVVQSSPPAQEDTPPVAQKEELSADSLYSQGVKLLKDGHEQEARSIFTNLLATARRDGNRQLEVNALQMLADLDFGHQEYASARRKYAELRRLDSTHSARSGRYMAALEAVGTRRDELDAYAALLLGCLTCNPEKDGFTVVQQASEFTRLFQDSPLKTDAEDWAKKIEQKAEQWFAAVITEANQLPADQALKRLEQIPLDILPLDKQEILRQKKEAIQAKTTASPSLEPAQDIPADGTPVPQGDEPHAVTSSPLPDPAAVLQETWDKGVAALQAEEYDQALELFSKLQGTELAAQAEGKIEEAERLAGERVRKKAAALFQQALNTPDGAAKKELLLSSKSLLEGILRKYPHAGIEAKVKKNLSSVDRELAAVSN